MTTHEDRSSTSELAVGDLVGDRFRIDSVVGVGGMATVYRATDEALGRIVALKVFRSELADADDVRRQRDEVQLLASLNAPGLVTLFDAIAEGGVGDHGRAFLVLEFVDGVDLRTRLLEGMPDASWVSRIGADVAAALSYIHNRGVVHRDVKPGNILLPHDHSIPGGPNAKLADFGIARLLDDARMTATGTVIGTATYLSPEQAQGTAVGTASDVYSLGLVLLECLTGVRAFPGTAIESVLARLARDPEIPRSVSEPWRSLLASMTQREPDDRPDAASVAHMLREPGLSEPPPREQTSSPLADPADEPEPTRLLPTGYLAGEEPTRPYSDGSGVPTTVLAEPRSEAPSPARTGRGRRLAVILAGAAAVLIVIVIALSLARPNATAPAASTPSPKPSASSVAYPPVSGTLGQHLRQLQQSVAP